MSDVPLVDFGRYQYQPEHIKAYRWVRYAPYRVLRGLIRVMYWVLWKWCDPFAWKNEYGTPIHRLTRRESLYHIIMIERSLLAMDMQHYYTTEELFDRLIGPK